MRIAGARPDIVFTRLRIAVFIDGCFWHGCPLHYIPPKGNSPYWSAKIERNRARDLRNTEALAEAGYYVLRFWECEIQANLAQVADTIEQELKVRGQANRPRR